MDPELQALMDRFSAAQRQIGKLRLNERNCIEVLQQLAAEELVDGVYTLDGREFVTKAQLANEVEAELAAAGGRLPLTDLPNLLNVTMVPHVERAVGEVLHRRRDAQIVCNEMCTEGYFEGIIQEIAAILEHGQVVLLTDVTRRHGLDAAAFAKKVEAAVDGGGLPGAVFDREGSALYTERFLARQRGVVRGALRGLTRPAKAGEFLSALPGMRTFPALRRVMLDEVAALSKNDPSCAASVSDDTPAATITPRCFTAASHRAIDQFYSANHYIPFAYLKTLGIPSPASFLESRYNPAQAPAAAGNPLKHGKKRHANPREPQAGGGGAPGAEGEGHAHDGRTVAGVALKTAFVAEKLLAGVLSDAAERVAAGALVVDVQSMLPPCLTADDIASCMQWLGSHWQQEAGLAGSKVQWDTDLKQVSGHLVTLAGLRSIVLAATADAAARAQTAAAGPGAGWDNNQQQQQQQQQEPAGHQSGGKKGKKTPGRRQRCPAEAEEDGSARGARNKRLQNTYPAGPAVEKLVARALSQDGGAQGPHSAAASGEEEFPVEFLASLCEDLRFRLVAVYRRELEVAVEAREGSTATAQASVEARVKSAWTRLQLTSKHAGSIDLPTAASAELLPALTRHAKRGVALEFAALAAALTVSSHGCPMPAVAPDHPPDPDEILDDWLPAIPEKQAAPFVETVALLASPATDLAAFVAHCERAKDALGLPLRAASKAKELKDLRTLALQLSKQVATSSLPSVLRAEGARAGEGRVPDDAAKAHFCRLVALCWSRYKGKFLDSVPAEVALDFLSDLASCEEDEVAVLLKHLHCVRDDVVQGTDASQSLRDCHSCLSLLFPA
ncbi:E3 UFM1-protein ligase 1-like protein [Diplonema papillatum]|nr:E3 UFM1-protein ligase 1-like protein [Diplonema papillatum]